MANKNDWGLTDRGFRRPTHAELLDALEYKARELFGSKANLTVRSPLGMFMRVFAWALNLLFSTLEDVYNSRFIDTAVGTSLYNLGKAIGLRLLSAQKAVGHLEITGDDGTIVPEGWLASTVAGAQYVVVQEGIIKDGTITLLARATQAGPDSNTAENTITSIVNPMDGIDSVTNPAPFDGGRDTETDAEYRARYYESVDFAGGVNADAIGGEILQNVEGVYSAVVYENDTDVTDADGIPPHAFEAVVYGGLDGDVAAQIFKRKAAGIQTHGNTSVAVMSASGISYDINFSRPVPVPVYINIANLHTNPSAFPYDGIDQIKQALISFIGGNIKGGLVIGASVIYNRLFEPVFSVPGVIDFTLEIGTDGETYGMDNIPVNSRQKAVTDEGMVNVS